MPSFEDAPDGFLVQIHYNNDLTVRDVWVSDPKGLASLFETEREQEENVAGALTNLLGLAPNAFWFPNESIKYVAEKPPELVYDRDDMHFFMSILYKKERHRTP